MLDKFSFGTPAAKGQSVHGTWLQPAQIHHLEKAYSVDTGLLALFSSTNQFLLRGATH